MLSSAFPHPFPHPEVFRLERGSSARARFVAVLLALLACAGVSCGEKEPALSIREDSALLFTFFDSRGQMRTVEGIAAIDQAVREAVMVTDPQRRLPDDDIYVADLTQRLSDGRFKVWIEERSEWLDRVVPKMSEVAALSTVTPAEDDAGESDASAPVVERVENVTEKKRDVPKKAAVVKRSGPRVVLFGTSWCPSCELARRFFRQRGIRFTDLDVEKSERAAKRYVAIAQANNLNPGAVPLIVINGKAFQGFSEPHIKAALAL